MFAQIFFFVILVSVFKSEENSTVQCNKEEFECANLNGADSCIPSRWRCDGIVDCVNAVDENKCEDFVIRCDDSLEFRCADGGSCIEKRWRCDGNRDCLDGSDERDCPPNRCDPKSSFLCSDREFCIPLHWKCDGVADCVDRSDEEKCPPADRKQISTKNSGKCSSNSFRCNSLFECVDWRWVCDGEADCSDGSDELECRKERTCRSGDKICANGICKPESAFCNSQPDCSDGSDETNCIQTQHFEPFKCSPTEYQCDDGAAFDVELNNSHRMIVCLPFESVCRTKLAKDDCILQSACHQDIIHCEPTDPNCRCRQTAYNRTVCFCPVGFETLDRHCLDIDECKEVGRCEQICTNLIGSYECSCREGFRLFEAADGVEPIPGRCRPLGSAPLALLSNRAEIRQFDLVARRMAPLASNLSSDAVLDFWHSNLSLIWSDSSNGQLISCQTSFAPSGLLNPLDRCVADEALGQLQMTERVPSSSKFDGMAVDWIHELVFWTEDAPIPSILVYDLNSGLRRVLVDTFLESPSAIALDPSAGLLFWIDSSASEPRIERSGMNGGDRVKILRKSELRFPTALAVDLFERRIYWADSKLKTISSSDYYGNERRLIVQSFQTISHPFSMAIFGGDVLFTDRRLGALFSVHKFLSSEVEVLSRSLSGPTTVRVFHESLQPVQPNLCSNHTCPQLCLPMAKLRAASASDERLSEDDEPIPFMCLCASDYRRVGGDCVAAGSPKARLRPYGSSSHRSTLGSIALLLITVLLAFALYYVWSNGKYRQFRSVQFLNPAFEAET